MKTISRERLLEVLEYHPETGAFTWRVRRHGCLRDHTGTSSGVSGSGIHRYHKIGIDGFQYLAHRLAWFIIHNEWPPEVDHINGNGLDNRVANLRAATRAQNCTNAPAQKSSKLGLRGVHRHPSTQKFRAQITKRGKTFSLGYFNTPQEAHAAYLEAAQELHGEFVRLTA